MSAVEPNMRFLHERYLVVQRMRNLSKWDVARMLRLIFKAKKADARSGRPCTSEGVI